MKPELSVIAPCLNEEGNVPVLVERTMAAFDTMDVPCELVVVDDGSKDATWSRVEAAMAMEPRVRGARHEKNRGIVESWITGLAHGSGKLVCLIDSDLQNRPEDIPRLLARYVSEQADIAQAVRNPKHSGQRVVFSRALNVMLNATFGTRLRDSKSGFILCRREVLEDILTERAGYRYFQCFIGAAAGIRGYRVAEVDTDFEERRAGQSFLADYPIAVSARVVMELVRYRIATLR